MISNTKTKFDLIDRRKRIVRRVIDISSFVLFLFFFSCFYRENEEGTMVEYLFGFETYWRTIGLIVTPIIGIFYLFIVYRFRFIHGKMVLFNDKIEIIVKGRKSTFLLAQIDKMTLILDIPYDGDKRLISQKASRLKFSSLNKNYDLEFSTPTKEKLDQLRPYSKIWKEQIKNYKDEYR